MGIYLYCFTSPGHDPGPDLAGMHGRFVTSLPFPALTLWVGLLDAVPSPKLEHVKDHHAVVRSAWSGAPACLPARFGQWFADREAVEESLSDRWAALERALAQVEGAGEFGVRILDPRATPEDPVAPEPEKRPHLTGREYLDSLRRRALDQEELHRRGEAIGEDIRSELGGAIRAQRSEPLPTRHGLVSVSHLVPKDGEEAYAERLGRFRERHPELRFLTSGPWPPYSFVP